MSNIDANEILKKLDIVDVISRYINVTHKGKNYVAICPFHNDTNPSLMISKEKQIFKCFVCGTSGNAINFIADYEKISYRDAIYKAAELAGIHIEKKISPMEQENRPYKKCLNDLMQYYSYAITTESGKEALEYCESRGLDGNIRKRFNIGFAPKNGEETINYLKSCDNSIKIIRDLELASSNNGSFYDKNAGRIIFGITDANNEVIALSARKFGNAPEDSPKYINSSESKIFYKSSILYNFYYAKDSAKRDGYLYILEGFMDVIALYKAGITSAVGLMGTALSKEHIQMLKYLNVEIRLCLDGDNAGQNAMVEIIKNFEKAQISYRVVKRSSLAKDSDEILNKFGKDKLLEFVNTLESKQDFLLDFFVKSYDLNDDEERKRFVKAIIPNISNVTSSLDLEEYAEKIAKLSHFSKNSIKDEIIRYQALKAKKTNETSFPETAVSNKNPVKVILENSTHNHRISRLETELMYQMLKSEKALLFFQNDVQYFYNTIYSDIAMYLTNYYQEFKDLSVAGVINYISTIDDNENRSQIIDTIVYLTTEDDTKHSPLSDNLLTSIGDELKIEREYFNKMKKIDEQLDVEVDQSKKIELLAEKAKLKCEKNNKKGDK